MPGGIILLQIYTINEDHKKHILSIYLYIYISMYRYKVWDHLPYSYLKYKVHKQKNRISLTYSIIVCNYPTPPHWQPEKSIFGKNEKIKYPAAFEKWTFWTNEKKNALGYMFILHMCTINENQLMYGFWDMKCDRQNFILGHIFSCPCFLVFFPCLGIYPIRFSACSNYSNYKFIHYIYIRFWRRCWPGQSSNLWIINWMTMGLSPPKKIIAKNKYVFYGPVEATSFSCKSY